MIDGQIFLDQPVRNDLKTYDSIRKIATSQGDDCTPGCLLDDNYYKMIAIDLIKLQVLDADPKAIQQINFTGNVAREAVAMMFFIIEEAIETV